MKRHLLYHCGTSATQELNGILRQPLPWIPIRRDRRRVRGWRGWWRTTGASRRWWTRSSRCSGGSRWSERQGRVFFTQSVLIEPVSTHAWLRTLHWWRKVGKKAQTQRDSNPQPPGNQVCSTSVLQPRPTRPLLSNKTLGIQPSKTIKQAYYSGSVLRHSASLIYV